MNKSYFITGIGTGVGKTLVSAILTEKLKADYWKPIQSGDLHQSDSDEVRRLLTNQESIIHPETYRLSQPLSPHLSAQIDNIKIERSAFRPPQTANKLIIEGAGGLMVPLSEHFLILDLIKQLNTEVIVVARDYLGSINHSLLTISALKHYNIPVTGIIFNGNAHPASRTYILSTGIQLLGALPEIPVIDKETIKKLGNCLNMG